MINHQGDRFVKNIIKAIYNTVSGKNIAFLKWALKKDINDTRESSVIYAVDMLIEELSIIKVYDPKVTSIQIT